ncbi:HET-domain-containing protein [Hyaloscypha hepaticicola]|uniref:HET-domain-containing protein n=1 Tax=Hyaloscypha hepaticicola TaxID=2082293 RepID=A0A2J6PII8_9HELO|nr:HET-domain-containing protein [Hyaloscypha hepaticicola]
MTGLKFFRKLLKDSALPTLPKKSQDASDPQKTFNASFPYMQLDQSIEGSFRLVSLQPGSLGSAPVCTLLNDKWVAGGTSYEALSYVWGDANDRKMIVLNGVVFQVTRNLYSALRHLRYTDRSRTLWIDAICIDQGNVLERNHQVESMGNIYENCKRVILWLGDADHETDLAVSFIHSTCEKLRRAGISFGTRAYNQRLWARNLTFAAGQGLFNPNYVPCWAAVCRLLRREWWNRAWIFQEFVSSPSAMFQVGFSNFDWSMLYAMVRVMYCSSNVVDLLKPYINDPGSTLTDANDMVYARLKRESTGFKQKISLRNDSHIDRSQPSYFAYLINCQRPRGCGDPRDKVYSILTMTNSDLRLILQPDYSKSARWTYIRAVKAHIEVYRNLDILCYSMHGSSSTTYPSWCPDWEQSQRRSILGAALQDVKYLASGPHVADAAFSDDDATIWLKGFRIDTIRAAQVETPFRTFSWKITPTGPTCNWDLQLMALRWARTAVKGNDLPLRDRDQESWDENELQVVREISLKNLALTLVAGYYTTKTSYTSKPPDLEQDPATREWWPANRPEYFRQVYERTWGRTVIQSEHDRVGLAPKETQKGDEIFIFRGCCTPVILRGREDGAYSWIGDSYICGAMEGEAMVGLKEGIYQEEAIAIR